MAVGIFRRLGIFARIHRHIRLIRVGARARRRRHVHHFTRKDVVFGDYILCRVLFACIRRQGRDRPLVARQLVGHRDVRDRQVAVVRHRDLVGDRLAQRVGFAVGRLGRRHLLDRQVAVGIFGVNRGLCGLRQFADFGRNRVGERTLEDVGFRNGVGCCRCDLFTASHILEGALGQCHALDLAERDGLRICIDVCSRDFKGHFFAELVGLLIGFLVDNQIVGNILVRDGQRAELGADGIVVGLRTFLQRVGELVFTIAHQDPAAGYVIRRAFAFHEPIAADCHFIVRQRRAIVRLAVRR